MVERVQEAKPNVLVHYVQSLSQTSKPTLLVVRSFNTPLSPRDKSPQKN